MEETDTDVMPSPSGVGYSSPQIEGRSSHTQPEGKTYQVNENALGHTVSVDSGYLSHAGLPSEGKNVIMNTWSPDQAVTPHNGST